MEPSKASKAQRIERKPIPPASAHPRPPSPGQYDVLDDLIDGYLEQPTPHPPPTQKDGAVTREKKNELTIDIHLHPALPPRQLHAPLVLSPSEVSDNSAVSAPATPTASRSIWKTAVDETIHFAGGLISRPSESTKHYSVLRHSPGLVYYKGSSTSVTITIFSDVPLPTDRTLWLQRKGYSGDLGMNASALFGTSSNWTDVTPSFEALPSDISDPDERVWQRDIKKFLKNASSQRHLSKQLARETCMVRIPTAVDDGYLRILVCCGGGSKKVLCPSPVFRIASLSSDVSILRGASLKTMPLEVGLRVAAVVGERAVNNFVTPVTAVVEKRMKKLQPKFLANGTVKSTLQENFNSIEERYAPTRPATYEALHTREDSELLPELVGSDDGPESPFPISLSGKVVRGAGQGRTETGIRTASLSGVPGDLMLRLGGIYIGWAAVHPQIGLEAVSQNWHEAIITVGPCAYASARIAPKNVTTVHIIHDFGGETFFDSTLDVVAMAFLRPVPKPDRARPREDIIAAVSRDIDIAVLSLNRENWQPQMTVQRMQTAKFQRSFSDLALDARDQIQKGIDNIPMHKFGVRTTGAMLKDQARGIGGMYIRR